MAGALEIPFPVRLRSEAQALGEQLGRNVVGRLITVVNDSRRGVRAATEAARLLQQQLKSLTESARYLLEQGRRNRLSLCGQLETEEGSSCPRWLGRGRRPDAEDQAKMRFLEVFRMRLKEIVLENAFEVFRSVSEQLLRFSQQLAVVRDRLQHLADAFAAESNSRRAEWATGPPATVSLMLPESAETVVSAAEGIYSATNRSCWSLWGRTSEKKWAKLKAACGAL